MSKAVVLLSGGLDSSTTLYYAKKRGYRCFALIFDYGQRHRKEVRHAVAVAKSASVAYRVVRIDLPWKGSSLLDRKIRIPKNRKLKGIPSTYVPGRNAIFLSYALSYAEAIKAKTIFIGANVVDYSGYPDCRPQFLMAFQLLIHKGARDSRIRVFAPLIHMTKAQILKKAIEFRVPVYLTWSCYQGGKKPCGVCDSCMIREKAFAALGIKDYNRKT
jgi:7-cyano-7-deazaguanine synthase